MRRLPPVRLALAMPLTCATAACGDDPAASAGDATRSGEPGGTGAAGGTRGQADSVTPESLIRADAAMLPRSASRA